MDDIQDRLPGPDNLPGVAIKLQSAYVALAGKNLAVLVSFYQGLFERAPQVYIPERYAEFRLPSLKLALFKPGDETEFMGAAGSISLCLEVEDLVNAIAALTNLGYPPPGNIIRASHGQEIYGYDPAGNRLILHQSP